MRRAAPARVRKRASSPVAVAAAPREGSKKSRPRACCTCRAADDKPAILKHNTTLATPAPAQRGDNSQVGRVPRSTDLTSERSPPCRPAGSSWPYCRNVCTLRRFLTLSRIVTPKPAARSTVGRLRPMSARRRPLREASCRRDVPAPTHARGLNATGDLGRLRALMRGGQSRPRCGARGGCRGSVREIGQNDFSDLSGPGLWVVKKACHCHPHSGPGESCHSAMFPVLPSHLARRNSNVRAR